MKRKVWIYDTLRETEQSSMLSGGMTAGGMVNFVKLLHEFGIPWVEGPWPVPRQQAEQEGNLDQFAKAQEFYRLLQSEPEDLRSKIVVFGSTMEKNVQSPNQSPTLNALVETGVRNFCIFGKAWTAQVRGVLKTSQKNNLMMIEKSVRFLKSKGDMVFFDLEHFFDGFKADAAKPLKQNYAVKALLAALKGGADVIIFCDTNGGVLPDEAEGILKQVIPLLREKPLLEEIPWGVHFHDDEGLAKANTLAAIDLGASYPQMTTLGHGERIGMPRVTDMVPTLILKKKVTCVGIERIDALTKFARKASIMLGEKLPAKFPYVGSGAYAHKAGTHGVKPELQEHVSPNRVGNNRYRIISGLLGVNGIWRALKDCGIHLKKKDPLIRKVLEMVKSLDAQGIHIGSAKGTFAIKALRLMPGYSPPFKVNEIEPNSLLTKVGEDWTHESRSELEISLAGKKEVERVYEKAKSGQVDAIDAVIRKVLEKEFPILKEVKLADYQVKVLTSNGQGADAAVRVTIVGDTPYGYFETFAISKNVILASAIAFMDLYELVILFQRRRRKKVK